MDIAKVISEELDLSLDSVENAIKLINEGDTLAFISRYRKEATHNLTDEDLRELNKKYQYYLNLDDRAKTILDSLQAQGVLTDELKQQIDQCRKLSELEDIYSQLDKDDSVYGYSKAFMQSVTLGYDDAEWDAYLYVPESLEGLSDFFIFDHRVGGETFELDDDGAILTEKAARELGVSAGDSITVENADGEQITVKIADICENYMEHYLYISPNLYEELTGKAMTVNTVVVRMNSEDAEQIEALGEMMLGYDSVLTLTYTEKLLSQVTDMLEALDSVIVVLIMSAGLLAFIVLYNLNNININERQRELATLKVLGFYDKEISAYVYRENVLLTFIGVAVGCLLGKLLHSFVIQTVEIDMCMFGRNIEPSSYLYSILFTFAFSVLVNLAMHFKLKKINMVESLKSVE